MPQGLGDAVQSRARLIDGEQGAERRRVEPICVTRKIKSDPHGDMSCGERRPRKRTETSHEPKVAKFLVG